MNIFSVKTKVTCFVLLFFVGIFLLTLPIAVVAKQAEIKGIRIWPSPESTRVVFDLDGPVQYEEKEEEVAGGQKKIIINVKEACLKTDLAQCDLKDTKIKHIKSQLQGKNHINLVIILEKSLKPNVFCLPPNPPYGHRLVIDLEDEKAEAEEEKAFAESVANLKANLKKKNSDNSATDTSQSEKEAILALFAKDMEQETGIKDTSATKEKKTQRSTPQSVITSSSVSSVALPTATKAISTLSAPELPGANTVEREAKTATSTVTTTSRQKSIFIVAIDAGHGGDDPGAIGRCGTREKDVVLNISKYLKAMIDKEPGMKAVLIRSGDYYVALKDRMSRARKHKADLFISVHADAFHDRSAEGASVFTLSERGASSIAAKWIADRENRSDLIGGVKLANKNKVLASVLLDLTQSASKEEGLTAANYILGALAKVGSLHRGAVEQAGFAVLKAPDVPSLLVETGFISHPATERKLKTAAYQKKIATAIMGGIRQYARKRPH